MADRDELQAEVCLVLGASGFIGHNLCIELKNFVKELRGFSIKRSPDNFIKWYEGNFAEDNAMLRSALDGVTTVFHLIHTTMPASSNNDVLMDASENILATINLLELCKEYGVKRVVFVSSGGTVYGKPLTIPIDENHPTNPVCAYGISKLTIEKYLALYENLYGIQHIILRVANPFGPYHQVGKPQGVVNAFLARALSNVPIEIWGDGSVVRDYVYVGDVVSAIISAATYRGVRRIFNIGSGHGLTLVEVINSIEEIVGHKFDVYYLNSREFDVSSNVLDCSRALAELHWESGTTFHQGLEKTLKWYQSTLQ
jgi:UDP-glucose 4-epimerase